MQSSNGTVPCRSRIDFERATRSPSTSFFPTPPASPRVWPRSHEAGIVHGAIDPGAILFSAAHPAKLGAYGRPHQTATPGDDTRALAGTLRQALTGSDAPDLRPSQVVEGIPRSVDDALSAAAAGALSAAQLAASLRSAPFTPEAPGDGGWSWRWVTPAAILLATALLVAAAGLSIDVDPDSPFLFPATPQPLPTAAPGDSTPPSEGTVPPPPAPGGDEIVAVTATSFDPFGDNLSEREGDIPLLHDGDPATAWRTERYFSPLTSIKPGVGVVFTPAASVRMVEVRGSAGTAYQVGWAATPPAGIEGWETISSGTLVSGTASLQLPAKDGGVWLLWLTALPDQSDGEYWAEISEVSFRP